MRINFEALRQDIEATKHVFEANCWSISTLLPEEAELEQSQPDGLFLCGDERYAKIPYLLKPGAKFFGGVHGVVASRGGSTERDYHKAAQDIRNILGFRPTTHSEEDSNPEHPLAGCGFFRALRDGHYEDILGGLRLNIHHVRYWIDSHLPRYGGTHHLLEGKHTADKITINFTGGFTPQLNLSRLTSDFWILRPLGIDPGKAALVTEKTATLILPQHNRLAELVIPSSLY